MALASAVVVVVVGGGSFGTNDLPRVAGVESTCLTSLTQNSVGPPTVARAPHQGTVAESLVAAISACLRRCGGGGRRGKRRAAQEAQEMAQA